MNNIPNDRTRRVLSFDAKISGVWDGQRCPQAELCRTDRVFEMGKDVRKPKYRQNWPKNWIFA